MLEKKDVFQMKISQMRGHKSMTNFITYYTSPLLRNKLIPFEATNENLTSIQSLPQLPIPLSVVCHK